MRQRYASSGLVANHVLRFVFGEAWPQGLGVQPG
jgi:hypothetical protein